MRVEGGSEYILETDEAILKKRLIGKGKIKVGSRFRRLSKLDGSEIIETLLEIRPRLVRDGVGCHRTWPMKCDALGTNPDMIEEQMKADAEMGIQIDYDRQTGQAIFTSQQQYKKYAESYFYYDRNAGYSGAKKRDPRERDNSGLPQFEQLEAPALPEYA